MKKVMAILLLIFAPLPAAFATSMAPPLPADSSQQDQNKAIARRVFEEIFNQGKFQVADEIYAKDFVNHGLHRNYDLQEDQAAARWEKELFPKLIMTVDLMVAEGDLVTVVWTIRGTNTGRAGALPATGVKIEERGITVWRIVDGKIREEWTSFDQLRIVRQFVSQLKWQLMGLLGAVVILIWVATRFIRKLRLIYSIQAAKATS
jgi:predicted ester cyclase